MSLTLKPTNYLDLHKYLAYFDALRGHCRYKMGAKLTKLSEPPSEVSFLDCSGFQRGEFYNSAGGIVMPDGSQNQLDWCYGKLEQVEYGPAMNEFILAFEKPHERGVGDTGHIFGVHSAWSYECHGHTIGVDSRPWDHSSLKPHVYAAFKWPLLSIGTFALISSSGNKMDDLLTFGGHAFVPAWKLGVWYKSIIGWDPATAEVSINGKATSENRIINGHGYVPFAEAAKIIGLAYRVNNEARQIQLVAGQVK